MHDKPLIPVWFFIGLLLLIDGVIIFFTGVFGGASATVLGGYHEAVWWGLLLILIGCFYAYKFRPRKSQRKDDESGKRD